jgi:hypothetical protein
LPEKKPTDNSCGELKISDDSIKDSVESNVSLFNSQKFVPSSRCKDKKDGMLALV